MSSLYDSSKCSHSCCRKKRYEEDDDERNRIIKLRQIEYREKKKALKQMNVNELRKQHAWVIASLRFYELQGLLTEFSCGDILYGYTVKKHKGKKPKSTT